MSLPYVLQQSSTSMLLACHVRPELINLACKQAKTRCCSRSAQNVHLLICCAGVLAVFCGTALVDLHFATSLPRSIVSGLQRCFLGFIAEGSSGFRPQAHFIVAPLVAFALRDHAKKSMRRIMEADYHCCKLTVGVQPAALQRTSAGGAGAAVSCIGCRYPHGTVPSPL